MQARQPQENNVQIEGIYRISDQESLDRTWRSLRGEVEAFHDDVTRQIIAICTAANGFEHAPAARYTISQFLTDHRELRYLPTWMIIETVNLNNRWLRLDDIDEQIRREPTFSEPRPREAPFIPDRPAQKRDLIDAGCITLHRHSAGISIKGSTPENSRQIGGYNRFWTLFDRVMEKAYASSCASADGGSIELDDGSRVSEWGQKTVHETSRSADQYDADSESTLPKSGLPQARPVAPAACAIDDRSCEACS